MPRGSPKNESTSARPVRLLADMGVSWRVMEGLRAGGHDVVHAQDLDLARATDREILEHAAADSRILVTFDLDFAEIVALQQSDRERVVLLRLQNTRNENVLARLRLALTECAEELDSGAIVVVEDGRYRVRALPVGSLPD